MVTVSEMRGSRASAALAGLLVVSLPMLSMGPATAFGSRARAARAAPAATGSLGEPLALPVFNDPASGSPHSGNNWKVIEGYFQSLAGDPLNPGITNELLQVSMYRVSDGHFAQDLVADATQGATVQVLLDGGAETMNCDGVAHCVNPAFKVLEQLNTINHETGRFGTWLKTCAGYGPDHPTPLPGAGAGCLGQGLNHNKFMLATEATWTLGRDLNSTTFQDVVLQTSSNSRRASYQEAFNNGLIIANRPAIYHDYQLYFAREAAAYRSTKPSSRQAFTPRTGTTVDARTLAGHHIETLSYPRAATDDPLASALKSVSTAHRCANLATTPDSPARTRIDLGMFAISGSTSAVRALASLAAAGCRVRIVYAAISHAAYRTLHRRNVHLQQLCTTTLNHDNVFQSRYYVHSKYLLIAGTSRTLGRDRRIVYTGSENLGAGSLANDDNRDIRYVEPATDAPLYSAYRHNFHHLGVIGAERPELGYACQATGNN
jgi:phosphatidylserine/phosphatidylglycerophosphate/cardiolipin synthase-like enzyme